MAIITEKSSFSTQFRMYLSVFLCLIVMIVEGSVAAWTSPILKKLNGTEDNPLGKPITTDQNSMLSAVGILGAIFGGIVTGILARKLGRKMLLSILGIPAIFFFLIMAFSKVFWLYVVAKFLGGFGSGGIFTILPVYICELADPKVRGRLCICMGVFSNVGTVLSYSTGPYMSFFWFHLTLSIVPILYVIFFSLFALESPYYYLQSDPLKAEMLLRRLRGHADVSEELSKMNKGVEETSDVKVLDVLKMKGTKKAILIAFGITTFATFSGGLVIQTYTQYIFDRAGGTWAPELNTISVGIVQLVVTAFTFTVTDKFGKKKLFVVSYAGEALSYAVLGAYFVFLDDGTNISSFGWLPLVSLAFYVLMYSIAAGPLSIPTLGELFPLRVKSAMCGIFTIYHLTGLFLLTLSFQRLQKAIGLGHCLWIFGSVALCAAIFNMTVMIETRNKSLEEVQNQLNEKK